mgnify:FL=1|tara:strand:+ start:814 stop:1200 length:387 start_codon:yes stop_codon:yes gene_type:complete
MNEKINKIIENLETLTLLETSELITKIKDIFNIDINSSINFNTNKDQDINLNTLEDKKNSFSISLTEIPLDKKIAVLKIVRVITGLGLKESKDIVDNIPKILKENINQEEVDRIKNELESVGAKVQII